MAEFATAVADSLLGEARGDGSWEVIITGALLLLLVGVPRLVQLMVGEHIDGLDGRARVEVVGLWIGGILGVPIGKDGPIPLSVGVLEDQVGAKALVLVFLVLVLVTRFLIFLGLLGISVNDSVSHVGFKLVLELLADLDVIGEGLIVGLSRVHEALDIIVDGVNGVTCSNGVTHQVTHC